MWSFLPAELRYGPAETLGDLLVKQEYLWLRCEGCRHVAVLHPQTITELVGYDYKLRDLRRRLKCTKCGASLSGLAVQFRVKDDEARSRLKASLTKRSLR